MNDAPAAQIRIARAGAGDRSVDEFVLRSPDSTFCHLHGWRRIVEDILGREYLSLVALTPDGEFQGVLPLVRVKAPLLGHSLVSLPYLNYGGPIGTPEARQRLVEAAVAETQRSRARTLELRCRNDIGLGETHEVRKVLVLLDLPDSVEALWKRFPAKLRSQIRRPQKEGMELRVGPDQLGPFYRVFARNMRDLGTPVYPFRFFEAIAETFDNVLFAAVYYRGTPVGGACGFTWRDEFEITWASTVRDHNAMAPNMLLYCGLMEELIRRGVGTFNFGRSTPEAGTHRFKKQWGGRDVPLPWIEWPPRSDSAADTRPGMLQLASAAWRRLPLAVANRAGPLIAPVLPW